MLGTSPSFGAEDLPGFRAINIWPLSARQAPQLKNASLGFAIPYLHNGQMHDYLPDYIIRFQEQASRYLIMEVKGYDPLEEVKTAAAHRWVNAVNAEGRYGTWEYKVIKKVSDVPHYLSGKRNGS